MIALRGGEILKTHGGWFFTGFFFASGFWTASLLFVLMLALLRQVI